MTKVAQNVQATCSCGAVLSVHPDEIIEETRKEPTHRIDDLGQWHDRIKITEVRYCICPCNTKREVVIEIVGGHGVWG